MHIMGSFSLPFSCINWGYFKDNRLQNLPTWEELLHSGFVFPKLNPCIRVMRYVQQILLSGFEV